jgi:hypothetical protein
MRLQISDSGAFSEPDNGIELLPLDYGTSQTSRYNVVKIVGRKGGVSQYMGANRKQNGISGVFLGNEESMSTKREALENLIWNTDPSLRGRPISMSIVYREGQFGEPYGLKSTTDGGLELWTDDKTPQEWYTYSDNLPGGSYVTQSEPGVAQEGSFCAQLHCQGGSSWNVYMWQNIRVLPESTYTVSALLKPSGSGFNYIYSVKWITASSDNYDPDVISQDQIENVSLSTGSWYTASDTLSSPSGANYAMVRFYLEVGGYDNCNLFVDGVTFSGDDSVYGYTESQDINIKGYNISQRKGAESIYDVRIDAEEEY